MVETAATYLIVASAAGWVLWSVLLPARARQAVRAAFHRRSPGDPPKGGCGGTCDCG